MRRILLFTALAIAPLAACSKKADTASEESKVPTVTIDQLDTMLASGQCQAVDANGDGTRKKMGVIPGAVLLTDSDDFTPTELGADKSKALVFYCGGKQCGASHTAAEKAMTAGYTNVKVLPDGIAGWVKAGKKVSQI